MPKESMNFTGIACITIDSVMKMDEKNYLQSLFRRMEIKSKKNTDV